MAEFGTEAKITLSKRELLALLFKLDRADSAASLIRRGEDGKDYLVQAISNEEAYKNFAVPPLHYSEELRMHFYLKHEKEYNASLVVEEEASKLHEAVQEVGKALKVSVLVRT